MIAMSGNGVVPAGFREPVSETVPPILDRIIESLAPERVILFGSYAYGAPTPDSDVDRLVVMETSASPAERFLAVSKLVRPRPFPLDVVVKTPAEMRAALAASDPFVQEIVERGQTLYERPA